MFDYVLELVAPPRLLIFDFQRGVNKQYALMRDCKKIDVQIDTYMYLDHDMILPVPTGSTESKFSACSACPVMLG